MAATVKTVSLQRTLRDQIYLVEILRGLGLTLKHLFINLFGRRATPTIQYPEQLTKYPARFRGLHRLMKRPDGAVRCVACMMCSTACPSRCIHIEAGETGDPSVEKFPIVFQIDELLCVVCGLCVEACPCDAIRMDTGVHMHPVLSREAAVLSKTDLLKRAETSVAKQGGEPPGWQAGRRDPRFSDR